MKNLSKPKNHAIRNILALVLIFLIALSMLIYQAMLSVNDFFEHNQLGFNRIINIELKAPITISKRMPIIQKQILDFPQSMIDTPVKQYIVQKFGPYEAKTAIAIASAEGLNHAPEDFNTNLNGTIDVGYFRINSVHFKQAGCSLKEVIDPYKNIDCAYSIWKASGWHAWSSFNNGSFISDL